MTPPALARTRQGRPLSTEFREFRPLYLVERHSSMKQPEPDEEETYPSLPSSRTSSAHPSMENLRGDDETDVFAATERINQSQMIDRRHSYSYWRDERPKSPDYLDSKTTTPTAAEFPEETKREKPKYEFHSPSELLEDPSLHHSQQGDERALDDHEEPDKGLGLGLASEAALLVAAHLPDREATQLAMAESIDRQSELNSGTELVSSTKDRDASTTSESLGSRELDNLAPSGQATTSIAEPVAAAVAAVPLDQAINDMATARHSTARTAGTPSSSPKIGLFENMIKDTQTQAEATETAVQDRDLPAAPVPEPFDNTDLSAGLEEGAPRSSYPFPISRDHATSDGVNSAEVPEGNDSTLASIPEPLQHVETTTAIHSSPSTSLRAQPSALESAFARAEAARGIASEVSEEEAFSAFQPHGEVDIPADHGPLTTIEETSQEGSKVELPTLYAADEPGGGSPSLPNSNSETKSQDKEIQEEERPERLSIQPEVILEGPKEPESPLKAPSARGVDPLVKPSEQNPSEMEDDVRAARSASLDADFVPEAPEALAEVRNPFGNDFVLGQRASVSPRALPAEGNALDEARNPFGNDFELSQKDVAMPLGFPHELTPQPQPAPVEPDLAAGTNGLAIGQDKGERESWPGQPEGLSAPATSPRSPVRAPAILAVSNDVEEPTEDLSWMPTSRKEKKKSKKGRASALASESSTPMTEESYGAPVEPSSSGPREQSDDLTRVISSKKGKKDKKKNQVLNWEGEDIAQETTGLPIDVQQEEPATEIAEVPEEKVEEYTAPAFPTSTKKSKKNKKKSQAIDWEEDEAATPKSEASADVMTESPRDTPAIQADDFKVGRTKSKKDKKKIKNKALLESQLETVADPEPAPEAKSLREVETPVPETEPSLEAERVSEFEPLAENDPSETPALEVETLQEKLEQSIEQRPVATSSQEQQLSSMQQYDNNSQLHQASLEQSHEQALQQAFHSQVEPPGTHEQLHEQVQEHAHEKALGSASHPELEPSSERVSDTRASSDELHEQLHSVAHDAGLKQASPHDLEQTNVYESTDQPLQDQEHDQTGEVPPEPDVVPTKQLEDQTDESSFAPVRKGKKDKKKSKSRGSTFDVSRDIDDLTTTTYDTNEKSTVDVDAGIASVLPVGARAEIAETPASYTPSEDRKSQTEWQVPADFEEASTAQINSMPEDQMETVTAYQAQDNSERLPAGIVEDELATDVPDVKHEEPEQFSWTPTSKKKGKKDKKKRGETLISNEPTTTGAADESSRAEDSMDTPGTQTPNEVEGEEWGFPSKKGKKDRKKKGTPISNLSQPATPSSKEGSQEAEIISRDMPQSSEPAAAERLPAEVSLGDMVEQKPTHETVDQEPLDSTRIKDVQGELTREVPAPLTEEQGVENSMDEPRAADEEDTPWEPPTKRSKKDKKKRKSTVVTDEPSADPEPYPDNSKSLEPIQIVENDKSIEVEDYADNKFESLPKGVAEPGAVPESSFTMADEAQEEGISLPDEDPVYTRGSSSADPQLDELTVTQVEEPSIIAASSQENKLEEAEERTMAFTTKKSKKDKKKKRRSTFDDLSSTPSAPTTPSEYLQQEQAELAAEENIGIDRPAVPMPGTEAEESRYVDSTTTLPQSQPADDPLALGRKKSKKDKKKKKTQLPWAEEIEPSTDQATESSTPANEPETFGSLDSEPFSGPRNKPENEMPEGTVKEIDAAMTQPVHHFEATQEQIIGRETPPSQPEVSEPIRAELISVPAAKDPSFRDVAQDRSFSVPGAFGNEDSPQDMDVATISEQARGAEDVIEKAPVEDLGEERELVTVDMPAQHSAQHHTHHGKAIQTHFEQHDNELQVQSARVFQQPGVGADPNVTSDVSYPESDRSEKLAEDTRPSRAPEETKLVEEPKWSFANIDRDVSQEQGNRDSGVQFSDSPTIQQGHSHPATRDSGYMPSPLLKSTHDASVHEEPEALPVHRPPRPLSPTSSSEDLRQEAGRISGRSPQQENSRGLEDATSVLSGAGDGWYLPETPSGRRPSPVDSTTKDRSSRLFDSSPSVRTEQYDDMPRLDTTHLQGPTTDIHRSPSVHGHRDRQGLRDLSHAETDSRILRDQSNESRRSPTIRGRRSREEYGSSGEIGLGAGHLPEMREEQHRSIFGPYPAEAGQAMGLSLPKTPLQAIKENKSEMSASHRRERPLSDVGSTEPGHKSIHRSSVSPGPGSLTDVRRSEDSIKAKSPLPQDSMAHSKPGSQLESNRELASVASLPGLAGPGAAFAAAHLTAGSRDVDAVGTKSLGKSRSRPTSSQQLRRSNQFNPEDLPSSSTHDPLQDKGKGAARDMADVYVSSRSACTSHSLACLRLHRSTHNSANHSDTQDGYGEFRGSPRSPTRPPSVRSRQSMQQMKDLEARLEQLASENRLLASAKLNAEQQLQDVHFQQSRAESTSRDALETRDLQLRERDESIEKMKETLDWLHKEVARLTELNEGLTSTNTALASTHEQHEQRFSQLEGQHTETHEQWQESSRELETLRSQHAELSTGMEDIVRHEIDTALAEKNAELRRLYNDLEIAKEKIRELQQQILASQSDEIVNVRDEDYFDHACQQLCQHVQQWVLRFSKFSDTRMCRLTSEVRDEKTVDRFDNAILDGSDVDAYLGDRVKRRDVFMSVVMTMIWEYIFTRYLFGMDREQRQKLKQLEKSLGEVGSPSSVHRWRAMTLTLLSKRESFKGQRTNDTEAVVQEVFKTLSRFLPPPHHLEGQIQDSLRNVMTSAVDLSIEMRTQRAEYIMLPPLQPEYDTNGDLARKVYFNAALMNERSGETTSNDELEADQAVVRMVLFPLVVKKGSDSGEGDEEIVVCPAQVLVARSGKDKKVVRVLSGDRMSLDQTSQSVHSFAPPSMDMGNVI